MIKIIEDIKFRLFSVFDSRIKNQWKRYYYQLIDNIINLYYLYSGEYGDMQIFLIFNNDFIIL